MEKKLNKITTNLWFNTEAEEAARHYTSIFPNSSIGKVIRYGKERHEIEPLTEGDIMTVHFILDGHEFVALNGGPQFKFTEAISFIVNCDSQDEIDFYWEKLSEGGDEKAQVCGWLKDKYGVSWQIVPSSLNEMLTDPVKSEKVMKALLQMKKIDMNVLKEVFED
ncbi:hypothetical protein A8F94_01055 [Bacillus sp. FJAT-27225]|uniref:VOC family protein n=1 Tax=Bacillus sp. FJAT-27225 TaxID=1743144 RepID=UPI00080C30D6|nr:VOC family protein [Bacillus sp. FJAT-27225]OCA90505.1 hypothetical protein A8F94_01055 [Bacillus sp. FJAT-27225]